jgi:hypothetical protein
MTFQEALTMGNEMLDLLKRQHQYFQELEKLSESQRELIQNQKSEELLHILGVRQKVVSQMNEIHQKTADYRKRWPEFKDLLPEHLKNSISELLEKLQAMLNVIIEQDKQDCQELSQSKQQIADQLKHIGQAKVVTTSYAQPKNKPYCSGPGGHFHITG